MQEHRKTLRFECNESLLFRSHAKTCESTVLDISKGGLRLACSAKLPVGTNLILKPKQPSRGKAPVKGVVRWRSASEPYQVGLQFRDSVDRPSRDWIRALLPDEGAALETSQQRRSEIRAQVEVPVVAASGSVEGTTLDLSKSGARFEVDQQLPDTVELYVCLPWSFVEVTADIVRTERHGEKWIHSVRFTELEKEQKEALNAFVDDIL